MSVRGICVQSQTAMMDKEYVKHTSDWLCDTHYEHGPTDDYTSQDNCSLYSPMVCCCFLPVESHSSGHNNIRNVRVSIWIFWLYERCVKMWLAFLLDTVWWLKYCHWQQHDIQSTTFLQWSACSFCPLTSTALVLWEKCPASTQMSRREDFPVYSI